MSFSVPVTGRVDFGTSQQTIPVLLRQDHYKESFYEVSSQKVF